MKIGTFKILCITLAVTSLIMASESNIMFYLLTIFIDFLSVKMGLKKLNLGKRIL
jgi:hypothetical protein